MTTPVCPAMRNGPGHTANPIEKGLELKIDGEGSRQKRRASLQYHTVQYAIAFSS
jgi:hypothetical protein